MEIIKPTRLRPRPTRAVTTPILNKSEIKDYVHNVVKDLLRQMGLLDVTTPILNKSEIKGYVQNVAKDLLRQMGISAIQDHVSNLKPLPANVTNKITGAVRQLKCINAEGLQEHLGTIVFLKPDLAVTCFHEVFNTGQILEDTLRVDDMSLKHIVSFPYYDIAFFKCPGRKEQWLDLGDVQSIGYGGLVYLASYPAIVDSRQNDNVVICSGSVCQIEDPAMVATVLAQYQCFPGSSGGAVLSSTGKLLGIHLESVYHEDGTFLQQPDWYYECLPSEALRVLQWDKGLDKPSSENFWETADTDNLLKYAAQNVCSKGHLGRFQSVSVIRTKLLEGDILPKPGRKRPRSVSKW